EKGHIATNCPHKKAGKYVAEARTKQIMQLRSSISHIPRQGTSRIFTRDKSDFPYSKERDKEIQI
ncbi:22202_t:CDS:2, partial [Dentiscutata erythropus]